MQTKFLKVIALLVGGPHMYATFMRTALDEGSPRGAIAHINKEIGVDSDDDLPHELQGDNALLVLDRAGAVIAFQEKDQSWAGALAFSSEENARRFIETSRVEVSEIATLATDDQEGIAGLIAARLGRSVFKNMWAKIDSAEPPKPSTEDANLPKVVGAAALEAATMAGVGAAVERASAGIFHYLFGIWPGKPQTEEES